jgi:hypothetical protein
MYYDTLDCTSHFKVFRENLVFTHSSCYSPNQFLGLSKCDTPTKITHFYLLNNFFFVKNGQGVFKIGFKQGPRPLMVT